MHFAMLVIGEDTMGDIYKYSESETSTLPLDTAIENVRNLISGYINKQYIKYKKGEISFDSAKYAIRNVTEEEITPENINAVMNNILNLSNEKIIEVIKYFDNGEVDDENNIVTYNYNPDGKYDWFSLGGRWYGLLKLKDGAISGIHGDLSPFDGSSHDPKMFDGAKFGDIDWSSEEMNNFSLFGWVDQDGWIDRYELDMDSNSQTEEWVNLFKGRMSEIDDDTMVYVVDFHV